MPYPHRPRTTLEALFESPFVGSDNGDLGIWPTLGEDVGEKKPLSADRPRKPAPGEPRPFAPRPRPIKPWSLPHSKARWRLLKLF